LYRCIPNTYGGPLCDAVVVDLGNHNAVYVSGLTGNDATGKVTATTFEEEAELCLGNLARVMREAGGSLADVVQIVAYVTDLAYYPPYRKARMDAFGGNIPASATVGIASLLVNARLEIYATGIIMKDHGRSQPA
jgi:enamine deaminase RidA (YjgF/YER057c/UK114 family)